VTWGSQENRGRCHLFGLGWPARWRVHRADGAHGIATATAKCTREDGTVWLDVEVPISQDYEDAGATRG